MDFTSATVMGRLAADPVFTKGQKEDGSDDRCWARIAVNRPTKQKEADYFPVCAWGLRARILAEHCKKGKTVLVHGTLRTNNKQRPDASYDNYTEILVSQIILGPMPITKGQEIQPAENNLPIHPENKYLVSEFKQSQIIAVQKQIAALLSKQSVAK